MNPKRLGFQVVNVRFRPFDFDIQCIVGPRDNVLKYVRYAMNDPEFTYDNSRSRGTHFHRRGHAPIIWIPRKPRTPTEHGTLAHEMLHAVRNMLVDWAGMELNVDTDEAFCHALGYGVRTVLEGLK